MFSWIRIRLIAVACLSIVCVLPRSFDRLGAADAPGAPYVLRGDLSEIKSKGTIRFLVHGEANYLPRAGDPRAAERSLAEDFATRLGLTAAFVSVAEQDDSIS